MENAGRKAKILAAVFASVAALGAGYYYRNDIVYELCEVVHPAWNAGEQRLSDAYGRRFTLMNCGDGTETALYDDSTAVTFRLPRTILRSTGARTRAARWMLVR